MALKRNNAALTEAAIRDYERRNAPAPKVRDYVQEEADYIYKQSIAASAANTVNARNLSKFLGNVKTMMLEECILKLYNECLASILSESEQEIINPTMRRNLVHDFVQENGGTNALLTKFYHKNVFLSEVAKCVNHYSTLVEKACEKDKGKSCQDGEGFYKIPSDVQDSFYKDLDTGDFGDVSMQISGRVIDAIDKFVADNNEAMNNIKEILTTTKEKVNTSKKTGQAAADEAAMLENVAKRQISRVKQRRKQNLFGFMVEQTAKDVVKNDSLRESFVNNGVLDVDKVKTYCAATYTIMEMANTSGMLNINDEYIKKYINSL